MKKIITLLTLVFLIGNLFAQAPQRMSYQAVVRSSTGELIVNKPVSMRISILQGSVNGNAVYTELHSATTNGNGLVSIEIGNGTNRSGALSSISWGAGTFFLKTDTDPSSATGTNYTISGTSQLLSVPYALFSANGVPAGSTSNQNQTLSWCNGTPTWGPCLPILTTTAISSITGSSAQSGGTITSDGGNPVSSRGVVWGTSTQPSLPSFSRTIDGTGVGTFVSNLTSLSPNTTYFVRAYAINSFGTSYGNEVSFTTPANLPTVSTTGASIITENSARSGGNVSNSGGATVTERGIVWSTSFSNPEPTIQQNNGRIINDQSGTGSFTSIFTNLIPGTNYFVRAYATNSAGTGYGNAVNFQTPSNTYPFGSAFCNNTRTDVVAVQSPNTGRFWMDRNLGATRAATSSTDNAAYGDLYQWGRFADGHQCRNSSPVNGPVQTDLPGNSFILSSDINNDWRSPQNSFLWQGSNGSNNPCPLDFRLPTNAEFRNEINGGLNNPQAAFNSPLRMVLAGFRNGSIGTGNITETGLQGRYWTSSRSGTNSTYLYIDNSSIISDINNSRNFGYSVRCIRNN